jgi:hypothetical protein
MIALFLMDTNHQAPYKQKSRWKVRLKKNAVKHMAMAINLAGELLYKAIALLPNYTTRHKINRRRVRPLIFDKTKKKQKKSSVSKILKIMSLAQNKAAPYMQNM